jgi:Na+/H+ antiporter NhaD/arsenite permease-like protein
MLAWRTAAVAVIFAATYLGLALGRLPWLRVDRAGMALVGASAMLVVGALDFGEALRAVDLDTIVLLLGTMIIIGHLRESGVFRLASSAVLARAHAPFVLLATVVCVTGLLSAFLVNDAICLVMAPVVIEVTRHLGRKPLPYLLAVAMASNAGSVATITGNPQNMIIGHASQIPYVAFLLRLGPPAVMGLVLTILLIALFFRKDLFAASAASPRESGDAAPVEKPVAQSDKRQIVKAAIVGALVFAAFFAGFPVAEAAIIGASFLLVSRTIVPTKIYVGIDGPLLLMFAGLFIVVAAAQKVLFGPEVTAAAAHMHLENGIVLTAVTALLSNLVSNVPAVLVLKPFIEALPHPQKAWELVAMSSTFAGNLTLVGSVANLIVAEQARRAGLEISFFAYLRVGVPLTVLSLLFGLFWLGGV